MPADAPPVVFRLLAAVLAGLLAASSSPAASAAQAPEERVPTDLDAQTAAYADALQALADAPDSDQALQNALARHNAMLPFVADLAPASHDLLKEYGASLGNGDTSDRHSLARAMRQEVQEKVVPAVDDWARLRTAIVLGTPTRTSDGLNVPVLLVNAPARGIAAFDLRVSFQGAPITSATVEVGQGEARVEPDGASARIGSFDARALAGVGGSGSVPAVALGHVVVALEGGAPANVEIIDLAASDGSSIPAISLDRTVSSADAIDASSPWLRWAGFGAVGILAVGGIFAARRYLKV